MHTYQLVHMTSHSHDRHSRIQYTPGAPYLLVNWLDCKLYCSSRKPLLRRLVGQVYVRTYSGVCTTCSVVCGVSSCVSLYVRYVLCLYSVCVLCVLCLLYVLCVLCALCALYVRMYCMYCVYCMYCMYCVYCMYCMYCVYCMYCMYCVLINWSRMKWLGWRCTTTSPSQWDSSCLVWWAAPFLAF